MEMESGVIEANLGGNVYKKLSLYRNAVNAVMHEHCWLINVKKNELKALKLLASHLLRYTDTELTVAMNKNHYIRLTIYMESHILYVYEY